MHCTFVSDNLMAGQWLQRTVFERRWVHPGEVENPQSGRQGFAERAQPWPLGPLSWIGTTFAQRTRNHKGANLLQTSSTCKLKHAASCRLIDVYTGLKLFLLQLPPGSEVRRDQTGQLLQLDYVARTSAERARVSSRSGSDNRSCIGFAQS